MIYRINRCLCCNLTFALIHIPILLVFQFEIYAENAGSSSATTKTEAYVGVASQEERDKWIIAIKKVIYGLRGISRNESRGKL